MYFIQAFKKTFAITALVATVIFTIQAIPVARAVDATFNVYLTVDSEISINGTTAGTTTLADITLLPNISISNSVASNSQNDIEIQTTDPDGYTLTLQATSSPAMGHLGAGTDIANLLNGSSTAEWDVLTGATEFGFGVFSSDNDGSTDTDIVNAFENPESDSNYASGCLGLAPNDDPNFANVEGVHGADREVGFSGALTTPITIAERNSATSGANDIDICFYVEANSDSPDAGSYVATMILRATAN